MTKRSSAATASAIETLRTPAADKRVAVAIGEKIYKNGRIQKYVISMADGASAEPIVFELMDKDLRRFRKSWPLSIPRGHDRFLIGEREAHALRDFHELLHSAANDRAKSSVPAPIKGHWDKAARHPGQSPRGKATPSRPANDPSHLVAVDEHFLPDQAPLQPKKTGKAFGKAVRVAALSTTALAEMSLIPVPASTMNLASPTPVAAAHAPSTGDPFMDMLRDYPEACTIQSAPAPDPAVTRLALTEANMTARGPAALSQMKWIREVDRATRAVERGLPGLFKDTHYNSIDAGNYYALRVAAIESRFNTATVNKNAQGLYHFMPGTWQHVWRTHPEALKLVGGQIPDLGKRFDPYVATIALHLLVADNYRELSRNLENYVPSLIGTKTSTGRVIDRAYARALINQVLENANPYGLHVLGGSGYTRPAVQSIIHPDMPSTVFAQNLAGNRGLYFNGGRVRSVNGQMDELLDRISPALASMYGVANDYDVTAETNRYYAVNPPWLVCDLTKMDRSTMVTAGGTTMPRAAALNR